MTQKVPCLHVYYTVYNLCVYPRTRALVTERYPGVRRVSQVLIMSRDRQRDRQRAASEGKKET